MRPVNANIKYQAEEAARMTIEQLREFVTVVQFKNITRAAEFLYLSQPTLSRHLFELEDALGTQLLDRSSARRFSLTPAGEVLYKEGQAILAAIGDVEYRVQRAGSGEDGLLRISSGLLYCEPFSHAVGQLRRTCPALSVQIAFNAGRPTSQSVLGGSADVGLCYRHELGSLSEGLEFLPLGDDTFCVLLSALHPLAQRKSVSVHELSGERMLFVRDPETGFYDGDAFAALMAQFPNRAPEASVTMEAMVLQTRYNLGFCILPARAANEYRCGCAVIPLTGSGALLHTQLGAVWKRSNRNPALHRFLALLPGGSAS